MKYPFFFKLLAASFAILCSFSGGYAQIRAKSSTLLKL